jgi:hypothetical protein
LRYAASTTCVESFGRHSYIQCIQSFHTRRCTSRNNPQVNTTDPTISTYPTIAALGQIHTDSCAKQHSTPGPLQSLTIPRRLIQLPGRRRSENTSRSYPSSLPCRTRLLNRCRRGPGGKPQLPNTARSSNTLAHMRPAAGQLNQIQPGQISKGVSTDLNPAPPSDRPIESCSATRVPVARVPYTVLPRPPPCPSSAGDYSTLIFPRTRH